MRYITSYKIYESKITKTELVDKIKWYSNWVERYIKDYNKFTSSNINFTFSYDTALTIREIFDVTQKLNDDSSDGFIRAVANEFITWSEYFTESKWPTYKLQNLKEFSFEYNYENYTDDFKIQHKWEFYNSDYREMVYAFVGQEIKQLISGTIWDIPLKKKFTKEDEEFLLDAIISDLDVNPGWIKGITKNGMNIMEHNKCPITGLPVRLDYDSDFMSRLNSYFGGVLIVSTYKILFPFYKL